MRSDLSSHGAATDRRSPGPALVPGEDVHADRRREALSGRAGGVDLGRERVERAGSAAAMARKARQNSGSSETLVRWPLSVSECFSGAAVQAFRSRARRGGGRRAPGGALGLAALPLGLGRAAPVRAAAASALARASARARCLRAVRRLVTVAIRAGPPRRCRTGRGRRTGSRGGTRSGAARWCRG